MKNQSCCWRQLPKTTGCTKSVSVKLHSLITTFCLAFFQFTSAKSTFVANGWNLPSGILFSQPFEKPSSHHNRHINFVRSMQLYQSQSYERHFWTRGKFSLLAAKDDNKPDDDMDLQSSAIKSHDEGDWRAFRAKLVQNEMEQDERIISETPNEGERSSSSSHWAYDTDGFIERGSIVLSIPSSDPIANDIDALTNQCYMKAIVLVLDVKSDFIQGIILNRPTNIGVKEGMKLVRPGHGEVYDNEIGSNVGKEETGAAIIPHRWKVWFGGEVGGPFSDRPRVSCLHSVTSDVGKNVSEEVLPGILLTSFDGAKAIIEAEGANPSDFWLFCGICGWETEAFYREMNVEGLWRVVSSDGGTILEELNMLRCEEEEEFAAQRTCDVDSDPRNAGLHTWEMLMDMIGKEDEAHESEYSFGDLMLKEWATKVLSFSLQEDRSFLMSDYIPNSDGEEEIFDVSEYDPASGMRSSSVCSTPQSSTVVGALIRASSAKRSPYLLADQGFHKSVILVVLDDEESSQGVILNHVTTETITLDLEGTNVEIPVRYGGPFQDLARGEGDSKPPLVFLLSSPSLREASIGVEVGTSGIFACTKQNITKAINAGLASITDVMAVQGLSMWKKHCSRSGVRGDIEEGYFEEISNNNIGNVWRRLLSQKPLSKDTVDENLLIAAEAWAMGRAVPQDDPVYVFGSDVDTEALADEALRRW
eukprot:CAMPEP_0171365234 /NCGR_PEP_ID=MMETSP0879-20121228/4575_1 /TAXON_ID=67004 /ORGANISM="Thalassiosira weissflogii, Strain CCMP1336" /LENGTH=702 /DNA_ID=CAMNT_0011872799 /DNA_START=21 /DNA_END=2126 /DNA_ORIENTATION=+